LEGVPGEYGITERMKWLKSSHYELFSYQLLALSDLSVLSARTQAFIHAIFSLCPCRNSSRQSSPIKSEPVSISSHVVSMRLRPCRWFVQETNVIVNPARGGARANIHILALLGRSSFSTSPAVYAALTANDALETCTNPIRCRYLASLLNFHCLAGNATRRQMRCRTQVKR
jgi:hypothetical protein